MALLGDAAAAGCSTDSVSAAAESKRGCDGWPDESPPPETTVTIGGYDICLMMMMMMMMNC